MKSSTRPELIVHIGTHKTGTTSIQTLMAARRRALKKAGIVHVPVPKKAKAIMLDYDMNDYGSLEKSVRPSRGKRYVMVWEGFCGNVNHGYANAGYAAKNLRLFTSAFDVKIVLFIRPVKSFLASLYAQSVALGDMRTPDRFYRSVHFNFEKLEGIYRKEFDDVRVLHYTDNTVASFSDVIRFDLESSYKSVRKNQSYKGALLEFARKFNEHATPEEIAQFRRLAQSISWTGREDEATILARIAASSFSADEHRRLKKLGAWLGIRTTIARRVAWQG